MITYYPIDAGIAVDSALSDLAAIHWRMAAADFLIPEDETRVLRVAFSKEAIIRAIDDMPFSTEVPHSDCQGLISHHLAYRVEGHPFFQQQSETWRKVMLGAFKSLNHFQFITGDGCLDIVTPGELTFTIVPLP